MKKLLITGFEPFGADKINPSWEAVNQLPSQVNEYSINKLCLPVEFKKAAQIVISKAEELQPNAILCIGLAGGRGAINPEFLGVNLRNGGISDNGGYQPKFEKITENGDAAYFSTIPVCEIADAINAAGIPSHPSHSAGTYVCNDVFYSLLHHFKNTPTKVGFIHVPYSTELNKQPALELNQIIKALTIAIQNLNM